MLTWEVIMNYDAPAIASASTKGPIPPKTVEQKLARKNELKAKSTLLLAIPDEHLLKFHGIKDAKTLWEAINAKFRGKKESKVSEIISQLDNSLVKLSLGTMDDLYNNLKVYDAEIKSQSSSNSNSQNVAFVSSDDTSSTKEAVNTAYDVPAASPQLDNEDLEQIDTDDFEEVDLKWQVAMLTIRVKRFLKKTVRNLNFNGKETVGFDKTNVECYNCHRRVGICGYDWKYQLDRRTTGICSKWPHLSLGSSSSSSSDSEVRDNSITELKNQLVEALREKDDLKLKLEKFKTSSMKLTKLINSQISINNKSGVVFDSQMNENELHDCHLNKNEVFKSASDSSVNEIEEENNQVNDRFKKVEGYHAVPPPYTGNYMPSRPDLSFAGLDDSVYKTNVSETISSVPRIESTASKYSKDSLEQPKTVRPSAPIIEDWDTDSDNDSVFRPKLDLTKPKFTKINFVKSDENVKTINKEYTHRQEECPRKTKKPVLNNKGRVTGQREVRPVWNNGQRVNHQNKLIHPHPKRNFVPIAVETKSGLVPVNAAKQSSPRAASSISTARHVNTAALKPKVNAASPTKYSYFKAHSPLRRPFNKKSAAKTNNFNKKVYTAKVNNVTTVRPEVVVSTAEGKRETAIKSSACWIWRPTGKVIDHISKDSGSYMPKIFDYVDPQGRLKSDQGIFDSGCSRHMTGNKSYLTDYQDIDGGFIAFARSPKGGKITGKGKIRTGKLDFEDVYFVKELKFNLFFVSQICDKKNSVLFTETKCLVLSPDFKLLDERGLTCLIAKDTIDESNLWHWRLGHINFKTMNKLVRGNLVRGLPLKLFKNDHTCVACQKGKQHKASCKPLQMLHMDLFGPTSDETSRIIKTFITGIENQINHKVKIIRCDNGTEFKNDDMNQFCGMKGIKREFRVARTLQQNGADAVSTACYVQNKVLVTKPHNKPPYELLLGRPPSISYMRPFGCPVTILNTLDPLGKFDGKADEGFLVGYSINNKAFRVFNTITRKVEENLHINFLENKPNVAGSGQARQEKASDHKYILLPLMLSNSPLSSSSQSTYNKDADEVPGKGDDDLSKRNGQEKEEEASNKEDDQHVQDFRAELDNLLVQQKEGFDNADNQERIDSSTQDVNTIGPKDMGAEADLNNLVTTINVSSIPTTRIHNDHLIEQIIRDLHSAPLIRRMSQQNLEELGLVSYIKKQRRTNYKDYQNCLFACFFSQIEPKKVIQALTDLSRIEAMQNELLQFKLQKVWTLVDLPKGKRAIGTKWVYRNMKDERGIVVRNKARLVAQEEVYVCQPTSFKDPQFSDKVYKVYVDDIIFGSTKKSLCVEFEHMMHKRFQISSMVQLTFLLGFLVMQKDYGIFISQDKYVADILKKFDFVTIKIASTPIETNKALLKDEEAKETDIMFAVCAYARFQVTPKVSHLNAVKRIFRYLKGQPKLGLWYLKHSPFDLEAFSDSDYAGASLDRKSIIGGCQFLGKRLISWQCKKQTIVANSATEAKYVSAANCCGQVLWIQNQILDYGFKFMKTKIHIDNESTICIVKNPVFHSKTKHIEIRHHFIRDSYEKKLVQVIKIHTDHNVTDLLTKAFDVNETVYKEWEDRIERAATTTTSLEAEQDSELELILLEQFWQTASASTLENRDMEITTTIDGKVKHKRLLLPHKRLHIAPTLTQKLFSNMKKASKGYTGVDIPLFQTMLVQGQILHGEGSTIPVESHHIPISAPSTLQPPTSPPYMQTTHVAEEATTMPYDSPLLRVHSLGSDEGSMTLNELTILCTTLSKKVETLEYNLKQTKLTYGATYTKLIIKVKKLEHKVKSTKARRRVRLIVSRDEDELEDPSKQGRKIS
ncbi:putative ribonuclease H-like domain-containing protein [Tanacetum coccineum]